MTPGNYLWCVRSRSCCRYSRIPVTFLVTFLVTFVLVALVTNRGGLRAFDYGTTDVQLSTSSVLQDKSSITSSVLQDRPPSDTSPDLLMSVPFYIYSEMDWFREDSITTVGNASFRDWVQMSAEERQLKFKHDDDVKLYIAATKHPMRVSNPEDAKLFIIPSITSLLEIQHVYGTGTVHYMCHRNTKTSGKNCGRDLMVYIDKVLKDSPWFQRSKGRDHIAFLTYFHWNHPFWNGKEFKYITQSNIIQFGEGSRKYNALNRISFNTMYVGNRCEVVPYQQKTADLAMIANLRLKSRKRKDQVNMKDRRHVCAWTEGQCNMTVCGKGIQCPALAQARLGFHARGDSYSANRLFDTLLSETVPIFTLKEQYTAHQPFIDWHKISFYIPMGENSDSVNEKDSFRNALEDILNNPGLIESKTKAVIENRDLFDFDTLVPFDVYGYMFQVEIFPDLPRKEASKYSVLIMPDNKFPSDKREEGKYGDGCYHVFLDIGANIGVHGRFLFEPDVYPNAILAHNVFDKHFGTRDT